MDPGNLNTSTDYSHHRIEWSLRIQTVKDKVEEGKSIFNLQEATFSSLESDLTNFITQDFMLEGNELQSMMLDIQETQRYVSNVSNLMNSIENVYDLANDHLKITTLHISNRGGEIKIKETNGLLEMFERMTSLICEMTVNFQHAVTGIKVKVQALKEKYGATDSD
ncbi:hypothetical protein TNCV_2241231 [Trichonephila clavipes]|nr:hypothetical protein TNCV_2241231 [Trichonephila clavipes]